MGRESHIHLPTNSPKWGNTASSPSRTWRPCWPWVVSACRGPNTGNCATWNKCAPSSAPPNRWVCPSGSREPKEDDWEVTFPGGGRWGPLRQPTPSAEPEHLAGGRVPSGPPLQAPCPAPSGSDMGQLITTLTSCLHLGTPKINTFSGDVTPGKTEVLFEQWNQEVQCMKDHYLESVAQESIMRSLKRAAADMAWYIGPTAGVSDILDKLLVIFRTVALFDVLMQNFYKITQENNEKVPSFAMRLEGTLNQIGIRCPGQITDCEVPWHLKKQLFHGVQKYVRDLITYLYDNSETTYSKLVVAAHQAESEMEETKERVKARSATTTEVASGSKELGDQIVRLMATLTRVEQGSCPASAPNSPRHRGCGIGQVDRNTLIHPSSHNGQTDLGQTASVCSFSAANRESADSQQRGNIWVQNGAQGGAQNTKDSNSLQCFRCQGWGYMARECTTLAKMLNQDGGT